MKRSIVVLVIGMVLVLSGAVTASDVEVETNLRVGTITFPNNSTQSTAFDSAMWQRKITASCGLGYAIRFISTDGSLVACEFIGDITGVLTPAGSGLTGGAAAGDVTLGVSFTTPGGSSGTATTVSRSDHTHNTSNWSLSGNAGTTPGTNFIGTTDSQNFQIRTNNLSAVNIDTSGNVGVGTPNPASRLHISGSERTASGTASALMIENTGLYGSQWFLRAGASGTDTPQGGFSIGDNIAYRMVIDSIGKVGIGTNSPVAKLDIVQNGGAIGSNVALGLRAGNSYSFSGNNQIVFGYDQTLLYAHAIKSRHNAGGADGNAIDFYTWKTSDYAGIIGGQHVMTIEGTGRVGIGTTAPAEKLHVAGNFILVEGGGGEKAYLGGDGNGNNVQLGSLNPNVTEVAFYNPSSNSFMDLYVGDVSLGVIDIRGGADVAESFFISEDNVPEGSVVVIDEENEGRLKMSDRAYDTRVAGVISGANGIKPALMLRQEGVLEGDHYVALAGRVYVLADATAAPIRPGDQLTTSGTPGHAMKVADRQMAQGAILGKAMNSLKEGKGYVLMIVTLQ